MSSQLFLSDTVMRTEEIGALLARQLGWPQKILLYGELGAGKTALTRGLAEGYGIEDTSIVHSPSFTLVNEYRVEKGILYHIDLYRLDSLRDLYSIGLEEILWNDEVVIIEWAEKLTLEVPDPVEIRISVESDETRKISVASGA